MSMFCFQCQETANNSGCTVRGVCGKSETTANLQDLLIYVLKGISIYGLEVNRFERIDNNIGLFIAKSLFATITNANFDDERIISLIKEGLDIKKRLKERLLSVSIQKEFFENIPDCALWYPENVDDFHEKAKEVGFLSYLDEDIRSLKAFIIYGCKGISAYADHAAILGYEEQEIYDFLMEGLAATTQDLSINELMEVLKRTGKCPPPVELEKGEIVGGFAHHQVLALKNKIVEAVKTGKIKRFIVMSGCDGRHKSREYYTEVAKALPKDTIILTSGCAKYRYNKLDSGDIDGIPRVLDAGQCNDSYSLVIIAQKLAEAFDITDINELPLSFDIAWYEQKAIAILLALFHSGVKNLRRGPTLPGFLTLIWQKFWLKNLM